MSAPKLKTAIGAFRILGRRVAEIGHGGLGLWTRTGAAAVAATSAGIVKKAHANECAERGLAAEVREILADGKVTAEEQKRLARMPRRLDGCAERSHDITEEAGV